MRLMKCNRLVSTIDDVKEIEVVINLDRVTYFYPTLDGKHTIFRFDSVNEFLQISEDFDHIADYLNSIVEWEK